ncbi:MAG TPA: PNGase F N-terminal domain-containing protein [Flavobacterium sp.]|nr:PNGase F N-terminal domain-containing protein [Flavobacterium sp.]
MKYGLIFLVIPMLTFSQSKNPAVEVQYVRKSNGTLVADQDTIVVYTDPYQTLVSSKKINTGKAPFPYEQTLIARSGKTLRLIQKATLSPTKTIATNDSLSIAKQTFEWLPDTKKILGYHCKKARTVINSNTIEIWYTNDLAVKGAPSALGQNLGLVLETVRNNNYVVTAIAVSKKKNFPKVSTTNQTVDALTYRDLVWKSRFTQIKVFQKEILNFTEAPQSGDSILRFAGGTVVVRKVRFPEIKSTSSVFAEVTEQSNGDAYDRTGSVFVLPLDGTTFMHAFTKGISSVPAYENGNGKQYQGMVRKGAYVPLLEVMRFFTPFGIKQYNHIPLKGKVWQDSVSYRQDISDLIPALSNREVYVGMSIGNYDKGGHKASLYFTIHDELSQEANVRQVMPLFNTVNILEMAGQEYGSMFGSETGLEVTFDLPNDAKNAKLRYIATGHGGWENGDEYLKKINTIYLDGAEKFAFVPWRTDCGSYRLYNPASGDLGNGLSSSDGSRSNWCPGTTTNPVWIALGDLKAGQHAIRVTIPMGKPEGSSFSAWNVSGVLEYE